MIQNLQCDLPRSLSDMFSWVEDRYILSTFPCRMPKDICSAQQYLESQYAAGGNKEVIEEQCLLRSRLVYEDDRFPALTQYGLPLHLLGDVVASPKYKLAAGEVIFSDDQIRGHEGIVPAFLVQEVLNHIMVCTATAESKLVRFGAGFTRMYRKVKPNKRMMALATAIDNSSAAAALYCVGSGHLHSAVVVMKA